MIDLKKIETDAVGRCKRLLDSMTADEASLLAFDLLEDEKELEKFLKVLFGFFAMAKFQNRKEEAAKLSHIAAYISIEGFLFEEWKKQEAKKAN